MRIHRIAGTLPTGLLLISLSIFLLAGCGSNTSASTTSGASATATVCAQTTRAAAAFRTAIGTIKTINGSTLIIANAQGNNVTVTYSSSTRFTQETRIAASALKEGTPVRVAVTSTSGAYSATSITVVSGTGANGGGFPGFNGTPGARRGGTPGTRNGNPCFTNRGRFGNATPGSSANNFRGLVGTVSQLNGNTLTITDNTGAAFTVTLTAQTQIVETTSATAAALKVGEPLTVVGRPGSQGAIAANTIAILLNLPARSPAATS